MTAHAFLRWLDTQAGKREPSPETKAKDYSLTSEERAAWLEEFGHLDEDPTLGRRLPFEDF